MLRVLVILAEGFEEIETATVVDVLRRGGVEVSLAGLDGAGPCLGSRGITFVPDCSFDSSGGPWDLVVLPGGLGGTLRLKADVRVIEMLRRRVGAGLPVAAICAAPWVLDAAGVLPEGAYTCYPGVEGHFTTGGRLDELVVDADEVITSQGPAQAMVFALYLLERLEGVATRVQVADALLYSEA